MANRFHAAVAREVSACAGPQSDPVAGGRTAIDAGGNRHGPGHDAGCNVAGFPDTGSCSEARSPSRRPPNQSSLITAQGLASSILGPSLLSDGPMNHCSEGELLSQRFFAMSPGHRKLSVNQLRRQRIALRKIPLKPEPGSTESFRVNFAATTLEPSSRRRVH